MHSLRHRERGAVFIVVILVLLMTLALSGAMMSLMQTKARAEAEFRQRVHVDNVAFAATQLAYLEIAQQVDSTGDGLGAMGLTTPEPYVDSRGVVLGELKTAVRQENGENIVVAVAAVPTFANPSVMSAVEREVSSEVQFLLTPKPAALSISGPVFSPTLPDASSATMQLSGGDFPAMTLTSTTAYDSFMNTLGDLVNSSAIDATDLTGSQTSTYEHSKVGEIVLPVLQQEDSFLTSTALDKYRTEMRAAVETMALTPDYSVTSPVSGDQTWGTSAAPQVTVLDTSVIGTMDGVFTTPGQTITGHGTLIVQHTLRPHNDTNINWTGDVFVLGYDGDPDDLLYLFGTNLNVDGNLILLASDATEASLEIADSGSRPSDVTVNGSILVLAEAASHEAEIEVENSSSLTVNGMVGAFGSRIELEVSSSTASMTVNGTLSAGMAQDLDAELFRSDDFELQMTGPVNVTYDRANVETSLDGLQTMEGNIGLDGADLPESVALRLGGSSGSLSPAAALALIETLVSQSSTSYVSPLETTTP